MRVGGRGLGWGRTWGTMKSNRDSLLTFTYKLFTRVQQQVLCCNSDTPQVYPDQDGDTMLSCLLAGHQNCTLSATKPLAHIAKKERKQKSLCMPTPYITTHVATLLEEHITFLFPSSENEGFSQEFQSLGAQANS